VNIASAKSDLLANYKECKEYREAFVYENVYTTLAFQIRALREQRDCSQKRVGREAKMAQERISILEDPNAETKPTLNTLLRLAAAFDVGLEVRFVPFSRVLNSSFENTPKSLEVPSFHDEIQDLENQIASLVDHTETGLEAMEPVTGNLALAYDGMAIEQGKQRMERKPPAYEMGMAA
jgi:transcriptional regulator with XRE-family HTH domain